MKRTILNIMRRAGAFSALRMANRHRTLILTYHRFTARGDSNAVSARQFEAHLNYLTRHHRPASLSTVASALRDGDPLPAGTALVTIDDGYSDAYEIAFPILQRYRVPATFFVVTEFVDRKAWLWTDKLRFLTSRAETNKLRTTIANRRVEANLNGFGSRLEAAARVNSLLKLLPEGERDDAISRIAARLGVTLPTLPPDGYAPLTWPQLAEIEAAGMEVGSHTRTHPILTELHDSRLREELVGSRERLEQVLQHDIDMFCYPNGDFDERVRRAVQSAGYRSAVTVELGFNTSSSDPLRLRRMDAEADFMRFVQITSGFDQLKNKLRNPENKTASLYS